jgi:exportin-1
MPGQEFQIYLSGPLFHKQRYPSYSVLVSLLIDVVQRPSNLGKAHYHAVEIITRRPTTRYALQCCQYPDGTHHVGIRNFVVGITVKVASDETTLRKEKTYINKLNLALVQVEMLSSYYSLLYSHLTQILKQEWPHNWPSFITELVESSKTNLSLCENNMVILKLLSEEIFDFSAEQMTQTKIKNLKNQMCGEFSEIFNLCSEVLQDANKSSLIKATLETLLRFLNWIPLGYIFETTIIDVLLNRVS